MSSPLSVLLAYCFLSLLHLNFFTSHYPSAISLISFFSIPTTVILTYVWFADFLSFLSLCFWLNCSALCIYSAFFKIMILFKYCIRSKVLHIRSYWCFLSCHFTTELVPLTSYHLLFWHFTALSPQSLQSL